MKRTTTPNGNSYSRLDSSQKEFIHNKVKELGSMEKVESHYSGPSYGKNVGKLSLVDRYARKVAKDMGY